MDNFHKAHENNRVSVDKERVNLCTLLYCNSLLVMHYLLMLWLPFLGNYNYHHFHLRAFLK